LETRLSLYHRLPEPDRAELEGHVQVFLAEKSFEGCGGLELTDEIKVCIAAQGCLLLLHRHTDYYPALRSILVYPGGYFARRTRHLGAGVMSESHESRLGEAWPEGAVVLAWDAVNRGAAGSENGHNVAIHEFAHLLDFEDGGINGAPVLGSGDSRSAQKRRRASWARVLNEEYEQLRARVQRGEETVLWEYGATDPAEFFAVATESFFNRPHELRDNHPALYEELKGFYRQDPAQWPLTA
jgi:Mlc titration factor MtfA (ptsG expression regulator)